MIKVDLHLHSIKSNKIGDSVSWISIRHTLNLIRNAGITIFSITDHDMFSYSQYKEIQNIINKEYQNLIYFPGIELTVIRNNGKRGHVLFIFDNSDNTKISKLEEITQNISFNYSNGISLNKAIEIYNKLDLDYFLIPHVDKSDYLIYEDFKNSLDKLYYLEALKSSKQFQKFKKEAFPYLVYPVKFSDQHNWSDSTFTWSGTYLEKFNSFSDLKYNLKHKE